MWRRCQAVGPAGGADRQSPAAGPLASPAEPPPAGADPADAALYAALTRGLAMVVALGEAVDAGGNDCARIAAALGQVVDDHQQDIAAAMTRTGDAAMEAKVEAWMQAHAERLTPVLMKLAVTRRRCAADPAFAALVQRLDAAWLAPP